MQLTDKTAILALKSRVKVVEVNLPEGDSVFVRTLTGNERDAIEQWRDANSSDLTGFRARIAASGLCQADGTPIMFSEKEVFELGEMPAEILAKIVEAISNISGLVDQGNDDGDQSDDSGSD